MMQAHDLEMDALSEYLSIGFVADTTVMAITRKLRLEDLSDRDKKAILSAIEFLELIKKGKAIAETSRVSGDAIGSLTAFSRFMQAIRYSREAIELEQETILALLDKFIEILKGALEGKQGQENQLRIIRDFFLILSETMLSETSVLLEGRGRALPWNSDYQMQKESSPQ